MLVMISRYQKFKLALLMGSNRRVGGLYRLDSRSLNRYSSKYVELGACQHNAPSHGRILNDTSYEYMFLFVVLAALVFAFFFAGSLLDFSAAARLHPLPRIF